MLAAQMQKRAHKAVTAVSVILTAARPVAVVGKNSSMRSSSCTALAISASGIGLIAPEQGNQPSLSPVAAIGIPASVTAHRAGDEIAVGDILEIRDGVRRRRFSEGPNVRILLPTAASQARTR